MKKMEIGHNSLIYWKSNATISFSNKTARSVNVERPLLKIGKNCIIGRSKRNYHSSMPFYTTLFIDEPCAKIIIRDNCRINGAHIHSKKFISIGNNCVIASGVNIFDSNGHVLKSYDRTHGSDIPNDIVIGNNVWIGMNCTILKGTVIGDNSVVSAGSIVKGHYPNNSIIAGNPAALLNQWK